MLSITCELAQRLEAAEALDGVDCAEALAKLEPESGAAVKAVAGGFLMYLGPASPLTHALSIGMHGPVTSAQLDEIEDFYRVRDSRITLDVCPYSDPTLLELLNARGYTVTEFSNVMVRHLARNETLYGNEPGVQVAIATDGERWAETVVRGFFGRDLLNQEEERIGRILFHMPKARPLLATVAGEPAGGGAVSFRSGVAGCFADATLVKFRRAGIQRALIRERMRMAIAEGCDLITAGTQPGSGSQRNYERMGFEVAYTKITVSHE